jgi:hypothetical protein
MSGEPKRRSRAWIQLTILTLLGVLVSVLSAWVRVSSIPEIYALPSQPHSDMIALLTPPYVHVSAEEAAKIAIDQEGGPSKAKAETPVRYGDWWYVPVHHDKPSYYTPERVPTIHDLRP